MAGSYRRMPGYAWCMLEGAIVDTEPIVGRGSKHVRQDGRLCPGDHRAVAVRVTWDEYPESIATK